MAISISWVGHKIWYSWYKPHRDMFEELLLDGAKILNKTLANSISAIGEKG